ncbi:AMP-binding protein [Methylocaldum szegediense]|uniref:Acyl-coenzyme A synthetase/AMP-(Fatty) acid ligase n=1 Tax=Methylocaldum szegediense TaxID=73780 RepID=A0ABN8X6H9_9GAMM|nr:AMP-binding protein [Methylocaldum szegediense]CAI8909104.1 Acyl-coenzyme A synthetase/AMP-(Fatty) acid ligase [Methylocaldum szegediense]
MANRPLTIYQDESASKAFESTQPLYTSIQHFSETRVIAIDRGRSISLGEYWREVTSLAANLPNRPYMVNLCENRYRFLVAFAAALIRGQVNLLPPSRAPKVLQRVAEQFPQLYCLTDGSDVPEGLDEVVRYDDRVPQLISVRDACIFDIPGERVAAIAFTSGSTGHPQPHVKTWRTFCESAKLIGAALGLAKHRLVTVVATVPPQHMYGLETSILLPFCLDEVALYSGRPFFPADIGAALEQCPKPRMLVTTPVHIRALVEAGEKLPDIELIVSATAPLSRDWALKAETLFQTRVLEIYGCTEAGSIAFRRTTVDDLWQAFDGVRFQSKAEESWVEAEHLPEPVVLNDVIECHSTRRFRLLGRSADLVNIAGKRTSIGALNSVLNEIEGVRDGVFFLPDGPEASVRLIAFAVAPSMTKDDLMAELRARLDPVFLPRPLYLLDELPRSETGKLPRQVLAELADKLAKT